MASETPEATTVYVSNVSPDAEEKTVTDFFGFCGTILSSSLGVSTDGSKFAIITFEKASAYKTALLLTNAQIIDRQIKVVPFAEAKGAPDYEAPPDYAEVAEPDNNGGGGGNTAAVAAGAAVGGAAVVGGAVVASQTDAAEELPETVKSATATVAELAAAGYVLGENTLDRARAYDETHMNVTLKAKIAVEKAKAKAYELDESYQVSAKYDNAVAKASTVALQAEKAVSAKYAEVDEKYQVSEKVEQGVATATAAATYAADTAMRQPVVNKGISLFKGAARTVMTAGGEVKKQTATNIQAKKAGTGGAVQATYGAPAPAAAAPAAPAGYAAVAGDDSDSPDAYEDTQDYLYDGDREE